MLYQELENSIKEHKKSIAIVDENSSYSYKELNELSDKISKKIRNLISLNNSNLRIGIYMDNGFECVASILGVLKVKGTYVPLSKKWPRNRIENIIESCNLSAVIFDEKNVDDVNNIFCLTKNIKEIFIKILESTDSNYSMEKKDLAYILYTSGSTGYPKGVCISHLAASFFVNWARKEFNICESDKVIAISSLSFDLSIFEIFVSLTAGAEIHIVSNKNKIIPHLFAAYLEKYKITTIYAVPSFFCSLLSYGGLNSRNLSSLKRILFAGEVFPIGAFKKLVNSLSMNIKYYNLYGPTETNVCTYHLIDINEIFKYDKIPIGKVLPNIFYQILPLDDNEKIGELVIFGDCVMEGYWGDINKSGQYWFYNNSIKKYGYRTGDIVEEKNGLLYFIGRNDENFKINGYRVDLIEIQNCILDTVGIEEVAICVYEKKGIKNIIAFIRKAIELRNINLEEKAKSMCEKKLPTYMIPNRIIPMNEFIYTVSGKIDKNALLKKWRGQL